jgi:hypothetical protein
LLVASGRERRRGALVASLRELRAPCWEWINHVKNGRHRQEACIGDRRLTAPWPRPSCLPNRSYLLGVTDEERQIRREQVGAGFIGLRV